MNFSNEIWSNPSHEGTLSRKEDLAEWVDHAEDHPDVDHLGVGGRWQGARQTDKAEKSCWFCFTVEKYVRLQSRQDKEDSEVDLDDDG